MNCKGCTALRMEQVHGNILIRCTAPEVEAYFRGRFLYIAETEQKAEILLNTAPSGCGRPAWCPHKGKEELNERK